MAKSAAERSRAYRERRQARAAAATTASPSFPADAGRPGISKRPLGEPGTCGLFVTDQTLTICDGSFAYSIALTQGETLSLAIKLLRSIGVQIELSSPDGNIPRTLPADAVVSLKTQGNA